MVCLKASAGAGLTFGWIWELAHPDVEKSMLGGANGAGAPDVVVYNAGLPKQACPPCNAGAAHRLYRETFSPTIQPSYSSTKSRWKAAERPRRGGC